MIYAGKMYALILALLCGVCFSFSFDVPTVSKPSKSLLKMSHELYIPESARGPVTGYCDDVTRTTRRKTRTVTAGNVKIGSEHPITLQTMTTTDTRDVLGTVDQVMRCADAGADLVRITVQGKREAEACMQIREELFKRNYDTPLVADIHFQPKVAMMVADAFEKIRVNPGNFVAGAKKFTDEVYENEADFLSGLDDIEEMLTPLILKCKDLGRAMRIGTNHGSLSSRIMSWYGDTPRGMVESALEFANICRKNDYHNFLFSMKASNPLVMVQGYRLLASELYRLGEDWNYPLHLGVTEAGEGEDGRMKSAIGIGSLLADGLGDTIRVSLTEDPEFELEPCRLLAETAKKQTLFIPGMDAVPKFTETKRDFQDFSKRQGDLPVQLPEDKAEMRYLLHRDGSVLTSVSVEELQNPDTLYRAIGCKTAVGMPFKDIATSDSLYLKEVPAADDSVSRTTIRRLQEVGVGIIAPAAELEKNPVPNAVALVSLEEAAKASVTLPEGAARLALSVSGIESDEDFEALKNISPAPVMILLKVPDSASRIHAARRVFEKLATIESNLPVIHHLEFGDISNDELIINSGIGAGSLLVDGLGDGVLVDAPFPTEQLRLQSFGLLQGSRMRNTKTEYVSCPSCGRTLFDLQEVTQTIQKATGHLPGVSIAVMGCIVNGVGEMADADFGYVGGAPGKVDLYVGKEMVQKGIPNEEACDALVELIKKHDRWVEKEEEEELTEASS
mmetsp:Transcript_26004/g.34110  ORF Transcript_26004/g.34110 Transcript_26004/m.34110 type:complete len:732 (+) Transcript_26004:127-2322(+)|eukprot:CAMPEP_0117751384 /NCGR_PEP_ID=MMETSP0947-20121206/10938_1 /TAXON_ID=44440 /ORGANISM="Chattonella subsalsa, Strain CCMP2191" /LENGTH=731 /DNA_ID=CAMNT_0005569745 /DNA_START=86 /DNA_END=2281 /DNA_ORIENTATION=-